MTHLVDSNKKVPPCPKCRVVPEHKEEKEYCTCPHNCGEYNVRLKIESTCDCRNFSSPAVSDFADGSVYDWVETVETLLGRALRDLGIETVEQVKTIAEMAAELRNITPIHDYQEQVYQRLPKELRSEYE